MALFPVAIATFRARVAKFPYLARTETADLDKALDSARAEVELYCPAAADGDLPDRLDRVAATTQEDLALYYLRLEVETDEDGAPPKALDTLRTILIERMRKLGEQADSDPVPQFTVVAFPAMAAPALPDGRSRGSTTESDW